MSGHQETKKKFLSLVLNANLLIGIEKEKLKLKIDWGNKGEVKEYHKEYSQIPKVKKRKEKYGKEYREKPENKKRAKVYIKEYCEKLENKERAKERRGKPENRKKERERCERSGNREKAKVYRQRPENREKAKERCERPENRKKRLVYRQKSEVKEKRRVYGKEYREKPENKEKINARRERPENKEKAMVLHKEYIQRPEVKKKAKEYNQRPEVKKKKNIYMKEYREKPDSKKKARVCYEKWYEKFVEEENKRRKKLGLSPVGEGFKSEAELIACVRNLFQNYKILTHHRKPLANWKPRGLELDIYIPKLELAFEYMGKQHYEWVKFFHTKEKFEAQKYRDRCKKKLCKLKGIKLIKIKYDEKLSEQLVLSKLKYLSLPIVNHNTLQLLKKLNR